MEIYTFMVKYFYVIIFLFITIIIVLAIKRNALNPQKLEFVTQEENEELLFLIRKINQNNDRIHSLSYSKVKIYLKKGFWIKTKAKLYFKQEKNIRIIIENFFGKQIDIGSNEELFWFWSSFMTPPTYYFSRHQDLNKTNLKTPLNPNWIIESMGFKSIEVKNIVFIKTEQYQGIKQIRSSSSGENISIITLIDPLKRIVVKKFLCDSDNQVIATVEYKNYISIDDIKIPDHIIINCYSENIFMEWKITEIKLNIPIKEDIWIMPKSNNSVSLSEN